MTARLGKRRPAPTRATLAAELAERVAACRAAERHVDDAAAVLADAEARLAAHLDAPAPSMFAPGSIAAGAPRLVASIDDKPLHPWMAHQYALQEEVERLRQDLLWAQVGVLGQPVIDWRSLRGALEAWADLACQSVINAGAAARHIADHVGLLAEIEAQVEQARMEGTR